MLNELKDVRQIPGEMRRRWFSDDAFPTNAEIELLAWENEAGEIITFELSYDMNTTWHVVKWDRAIGCRHYQVKSGDGTAYKPEALTVLLPANQTFPRNKVIQSFQEKSQDIDPRIVQFIIDTLAQFSSST